MWTIAKITTSLGILDKLGPFMIMSVEYKSFKWISDKFTSSMNNYIDSWEWVSDWNGQINSND